MEKQLFALLESAKAAITEAQALSDLENLRVQYLGKKGQLTEVLKSVGKLSAEEKPRVGQLVNRVKEELQTALGVQMQRLRALVIAQKLASEKVDITLPGRADALGSLHPITQVRERVTEIFTSMGYSVAEGPEIENEFHNFEALNIPGDHPARAMADTFYVENGDLLRTHTSPVQIREMEKHGVPIRLIALGRVYRRDSDQTHTPMFHQMEGLLIDKKVTFADLKGTLQNFLNAFFETEINLRFRPSYFPFTEPSAEVDIYWPKTKAWLEVLGCGMVHPQVLRNVKVDPDQFNGFAFGIGLDRLAMLRYHIPDLRLLFENDLRFLNQF